MIGNNNMVIAIVGKIKAAVDANRRIDELLGRDKDGGFEVCRYCGTEEKVCGTCGCCPRDHVLMFVEALEEDDDPVQTIANFGKDILILHKSNATFHGPMEESAWVYMGEPEMVWRVAQEQANEILEKIEEENVELDGVWRDALNDLF